MFLYLLTLLLFAAMFPPRLVDCNTTYIVPDLQNDSCTYTQQPCYMLSQYPANSIRSSNITFVFLPGNHHLSYQLSFANIHHLILSALNDNVTIICSQSGKFLLETIQQVHISNVHFTGCSMNQMLSIIHVTLIDSNFHKFDSSYSTLELVNVYAVITNCIFSAEIIETGYSSGALVISRSNISVANSLFTGNRAQNGGAIHATLESNLLIEDSMFDSNKAVWGGAIMVSGSSFISILNSNFSNNIGMYGGAINIEHSEASIAWSLFSNHSAQSDNSWSQYTCGGVLYCNGYATVDIDTITLENNRATVGGGIYTNAHCNMSLTGGSSISYNNAEDGGAIFTSSYSKLIIGGNSVISNNHANYGGGGIYASSSCVLSLYGSNVITNNHAQYGGGIYASSLATPQFLLWVIM